MTLRDRIGIDVGRRLRLKKAIAWAAVHDVRYIDVQLDTADNVLTRFRTKHVPRVSATHAKNMASISPGILSRP